MAGSASEERLRACAEAFLRQRWPDARIIHELVMSQGGCRLDLAAVTPDHMAVVEIKSDRDTLARLDAQHSAAQAVADLVMVIVAPKHEGGVDHLRGRARTELYVERFAGALDRLDNWPWRGNPFAARDRLEMLWAQELRDLLRLHGLSCSPRTTRIEAIWRANESLTGEEVRRAVYQQIRGRPFPRADPAVPVRLEPAVEARHVLL